MEKLSLSRRGFLRTLTFAGMVAAGTMVSSETLDRHGLYNESLKIELDDDVVLNFEECSRLAVRFDTLVDRLPDFRPEISIERVIKLIDEIVPMFEKNEIVSKARRPTEIELFRFDNSDKYTYTMGESDCDEMLRLSARLDNEYSVWYRDSDWVFALIHEVAHIQQTPEVCFGDTSTNVENSAQIGALEVAASMTNNGNVFMARALIEELRGMAIFSAFSRAIVENKMEEFKVLRSRLSPGEIAKARFEQLLRDRADKMVETQSTLYKYFFMPLWMVTRAITEDDCKISGLAFPEKHFYRNEGSLVFSKEPLPIVLDDLNYFLAHAEEIVDQIANSTIVGVTITR